MAWKGYKRRPTPPEFTAAYHKQESKRLAEQRRRREEADADLIRKQGRPISTERLWLTADGSRVVPDGSPEAVSLLVGKDCPFPEGALEQFDLTEFIKEI